MDSDLTAKILTEALPYIQRFHGKTIVIKYGGNAMVDEDLKVCFARDVVLMKLVGMNPVVVHGGGPQINRLLDRVGKESSFIEGMRVTDDETMEVVEMVLGGRVNKEIVAMINDQGGRAVGLSGKDGGFIKARKLLVEKRRGDERQLLDVGQVGEVERVDPDLVNLLDSGKFIPVIAPIAWGEDGQTYNVNADQAAGRIAETLGAEKLVLLTNTTGVLDTDGELIRELEADAMSDLIARGVIADGMIPKVDCAIHAVRNGVGSALIIDGRVRHALLLEIFTRRGVGTMVSD